MLAGAGWLKPARALAADWPKPAFEARSLEEALKNLYGGSQTANSDQVKIKAQMQAEDGANVPFAVQVDLPNVEAMSIYITKNERPLIANIMLAGAAPYFSTRMKMAQSSDVIVVARAGGKLYTARHNIKVTVGGCGG
jgi:sulfur-oxidizing protein SoxY